MQGGTEREPGNEAVPQNILSDVRISDVLIQGFFYVTEHCDHHNRVLYYRKPIWNQLCQMALQGIAIASWTVFFHNNIIIMLVWYTSQHWLW